jgi:hypothetical protein
MIERELIKRYKREYQQPIRLKVINFIKHWIHSYYSDDFANDPELMKLLKEFIDRVGSSNQRYQQVLVNMLEKKQKHNQHTNLNESIIANKMDLISISSEASINDTKSFKLTPLASSSLVNSQISNHLLKHQTSSRSSSTSNVDDSVNSQIDLNDSNAEIQYEETPAFETHLELLHGYDILTIHPLEFARQATLMEYELFKAIKPSELISLGWNKPEHREKLSPNLIKLIKLSNRFTYWYAKCIVDTLNLEERVAVVQRILEIAKYFYEMNNFSGLKEIYAAFETSSVRRLEMTRERSSLEQHEMYSEFKQLFENHDRGYLEKIKKCNPPCVPFIGSHLTIILKTQEYNKLNDENHKLKIIQQQQQLKAANNLVNEKNNSNADNIDSQVFFKLL